MILFWSRQLQGLPSSVIFAVLHSSGSVPNSRLALKSMTRCRLITSINSLSTLGWIPFGPGLLPVFSFCSFFMTLSTEIWISSSLLSLLLGIDLSYSISPTVNTVGKYLFSAAAFCLSPLVVFCLIDFVSPLTWGSVSLSSSTRSRMDIFFVYLITNCQNYQDSF